MSKDREQILIEIQNHNDEIGWRFQDAIETSTTNYKIGVIHHNEYIQQVKASCDRAEKMLLPLPRKEEDNLDKS